MAIFSDMQPGAFTGQPILFGPGPGDGGSEGSPNGSGNDVAVAPATPTTLQTEAIERGPRDFTADPVNEATRLTDKIMSGSGGTAKTSAAAGGGGSQAASTGGGGSQAASTGGGGSQAASTGGGAETEPAFLDFKFGGQEGATLVEVIVIVALLAVGAQFLGIIDL